MMATQLSNTNISDSKPLEAEEFNFPTDFYLLKNNKDYKNLLKSLTLLEVQRCTIIQNLEKLAVLEDELSKNPYLALQKVIDRNEIGIIKSVTIEPLPNIDWSAYISNDGTENKPIKKICNINLRHKNVSDKQEPQANCSTSEMEEPQANCSTSEMEEPQANCSTSEMEEPQASCSTLEMEEPWTVEEQLRLEELLVEHPPETNESNRYSKIAEALGTRNLKQVCSRVQKYNMKMEEVDSIQPINTNLNENTVSLSDEKTVSLSEEKTVSLSDKNTGSLLNPNTFIPSTSLVGNVDVSNTNKIDPNVIVKKVEMNIQSKLGVLHEILKDRITENNKLLVHNDFTCSMCKRSPILGTRWNCDECPAIGKSTNFCNDCLLDILVKKRGEPPHPMDHHLTPIKHVMKANDNIDNPVDPNYVQ